MRSKKAKEYIGLAYDSAVSVNAIKATETAFLAENEMMERAIKHYCHKCSGMDGCDVQPCTHLQEFIELLDKNE